MTGLTPRYTASVSLRGQGRSVLSFAPISDVTLDVAISPFIQGNPGIQGPPGAQGIDGTPGARYSHVQGSLASIWTVPHNLGFRPNVTITTTGGQEIWGGEILHLSSNTLTLTFDVPFAGYADCA